MTSSSDYQNKSKGKGVASSPVETTAPHLSVTRHSMAVYAQSSKKG